MSSTATVPVSWEPEFTRKHNLFIAVLLGILPVFAYWMSSVGIVPQLFILTVFVVLTGLPHGALDITLLRGAGIGPLGMTGALIIYIGLAALVVAGFDRFPAVALTLFLGVAWIHFGLGDTENLTGWQRFGECFARGGLSIAGPLAFHHDETLGLFTQLCGPASQGNLLEMTHFVKWYLCPFWLAACLLMVSLRLRSALYRSSSPKARNDDFLAAWEIVSLVLLFWLWPPLAAFGVYFCLVHSVRHLIQLTEARQPHDLRLALRWLWRESWPVIGLTLLLGAVLTWHWGGGLELDTLVLRLLFIGLAALTMPHMLLTYWWYHRGKPIPGDFFTKLKFTLHSQGQSRFS
jgi:Brp/Blh family beta-carotene 15,15'-monooxygenase